MRRIILTLVSILIALTGLLAPAHAATPEGGLLISPIRQFLSVDAGKTVASSLTIANLTNQPLTVSLSVKQFSVADYTYNYTFDQPPNNWMHLGTTTVNLLPRQTANVAYSVAVPTGSSPGGRYYTLFASATIPGPGLTSTIQATDLLYLTVNGQLIRTSRLQSSSIGWFSFGRSIPFTIQPVDTGNVYFFANVGGQLHGLFAPHTTTTDTHLLMPGKVRTISGTIPSPVLPGLYRATYGYKTDQGQSTTLTHWVVFIPPWFIAFLLAAFLIAGKFLSRRKQPKE